jgi:transcriptional regulator with XRE-family HTH domain
MFSKVLKGLRKKCGLTQQELADELKLAKSTISMYENGKREPDFETEELIADYFNVDINTLRGIKDKEAAIFSEHEKKVIFAYRNHPDMQKSVDKLLGIEPGEKLYIIEKAARNGDNSPLVVTDSQLEELENLPEVPLEDG